MTITNGGDGGRRAMRYPSVVRTAGTHQIILQRVNKFIVENEKKKKKIAERDSTKKITI
jgi:hypothetical protein